MRERGARALVRWVSQAIDVAYIHNCGGDASREAYWAWVGRQRQRIAFPIACRLDREAMTDQLVEECWWG